MGDLYDPDDMGMPKRDLPMSELEPAKLPPEWATLAANRSGAVTKHPFRGLFDLIEGFDFHDADGEAVCYYDFNSDSLTYYDR